MSHTFFVSVRLTTNGSETNVVLNKQLVNVQEIYLEESLGVNWNGGVSGGAFLRLIHPQLSEQTLADAPQAGTMLLVSVNNPHMGYFGKLLARGGTANIQSFRISVTRPGGTPVLFDELYLNLKVVCQAPDARDRIPNAMQDIPQIKGPDPRQTGKVERPCVRMPLQRQWMLVLRPVVER